MSETEIYNLSFTAGPAVLDEPHIGAGVFIEHDGWNKIKNGLLA